MDDRTLEVLEYSKILQSLSNEARSQIVKEKILKLKPMTDFREISNELEYTSQMLKVIARFGNIDIFGLYDFTDLITYVRKKRNLRNLWITKGRRFIKGLRVSKRIWKKY